MTRASQDPVFEKLLLSRLKADDLSPGNLEEPCGFCRLPKHFEVHIFYLNKEQPKRWI